MLIIKFILVLLLHISLFASTDVLKQSEVFIDKEALYTIENIQQANFLPSKISKIHRGYSSETVWVKFSLSNPTNQPMKQVLVIDNQMLDNITLYTQKKDGYKKELQGVFHDRNFDENILDFYFDIDLEPKEQKEYYLQVSSLSCAVYFKLNLMSKDELYQQEMKHQLILALFFGTMLALILYNLFIYLFTKDRVYIYYICYLFLTIWNHTSYTGMGLYTMPFLFSWNFVEIDAYLAIFYLGLTNIFAILFTRNFLNIKKYKKIDFVFKILLLINISVLVLVSPEFYPISFVANLLMATLFVLILSSYYLFYKKEENAKYFIVGWSVSILGWIMLWTYNIGTYSLIDEIKYFYELTIFIEAILFSIALSSKLNKTKELELSVKRNVVLTKELHHRVKNNMQFIIAMYRLKFSKFITDKIKNALNETEGAVQSMSAIHEMLYEQNDLEKIDSKEYFENLVQKVSQSYDTKNIKINLDIQTTLDINKSIYIGIILNELFTNSFKYAFETKQGKIDIILKKIDGKYSFIYRDNGCGFSQEKNKKSFGLKLIVNLVKNELKGSLDINSSNQTQYTILF